jgi:hypothetical protein
VEIGIKPEDNISPYHQFYNQPFHIIERKKFTQQVKYLAKEQHHVADRQRFSW